MATEKKAPFAQNVADEVKETNKLLATYIRNGLDMASTDWHKLESIAHEGTFGKLYEIGQMFQDIWKDGETEYTPLYQFNHLGRIELEDGEILEDRPFLQWHYCTPFGVQFSHERAFLRCPNGLQPGTYYFTIESAWGSNVSAGDIVCFTLTTEIPQGGRIAGCYGAPDTAKSSWRVYSYGADGKTLLETVTPTFSASGTNLGIMKSNTRNGDLNSCQEMAYGWNRWKTSALRQWLNSTAGVGNWWVAQDEWDIAPNELKTKPGFLNGMSETFVNSIKKRKVVTYANTVNDGGEADITYDRVTIPSLEEMFINPEKSGEGEYHEYWRRRAGQSTPLAQWGTYPNMITYKVDNHASASNVRLRSAYRGYANYAWFVHSSGYVNYSNGSSAYACSPLIVL